MDANQALAERFEEHRVRCGRSPIGCSARSTRPRTPYRRHGCVAACLQARAPRLAEGLGAATASDRTPLGLIGTSPRTHRWASVGCAARDSNPEALPKRAGGPIADLRPLAGIGPDLGVWLPLLSAGGQGLPIVRGPSAAHGQRNAGMLLRYGPLVSPLVELS